jgi:two-component system, LytTR family, sensor kinase
MPAPGRHVAPEPATPSRMNERWTKIAILAGGAVFMGSVLTFELYFNNRAMGTYANLEDLAIPQFGRAAMWALQAPWILALQRELPRICTRRSVCFAFHTAASVLVMATFYLGRQFSYSLLWGESLTGFWSNAVAGFHGRNIVDIAFYWGMLGFGYTYGLRRRFASEELKAAHLEKRLAETELKALRQQMHPHFLFNTLNTAAVLVREKRNDEAVTLLARLGALLRMSLDQTGVQKVTVRQELDFLGRYLDIQQMRFADRMRVRIEVAPEALDARIPNLLLQPLVENAIIHGIAPKTGAGLVEVLGRVRGKMLHFEVRDDGPGLEHARGSSRKEGVGLANTRERLQRFYGARAQMILRSEPGRGVSVRILLPYQP